MSQKLRDVFDGRIPYDWQLDAAESLILGLDCVIAGTGAGKTIPFVLPLFAQDSRDKLVLIISPLNALKTDQVIFSLAVLAFYSLIHSYEGRGDRENEDQCRRSERRFIHQRFA